MSRSSRPFFAAVATVFLLVLVVSFASAVETVTILEAEGDVSLTAFAQFSPTPVGYMNWHHAVADGPTFDSVLSIPDTYWLWGYESHCGADGMAALASWADLHPEPEYFLLISIRMELSCLVQIDQTIGLVADRAVEGNLSGNQDHRDQAVTLTHPDGSTITLVDTATGTTHAELVLDPGQYRVAISARYDEAWEQDAMAAHVTVDWVDASVPVETLSWSEVKALFR